MGEFKTKKNCCFPIDVIDDPQFDPSAFVASTRSLVPLERLRDDLQEHLSDRKQELYDLINRDYADFITVSSKLSGVRGKVADLREPMARLLSRTSGLLSAVELKASRLEAKLEEKRALRERKFSIQRCLRFISTLDRAERILGMASGSCGDEEDSFDAKAVSLFSASPIDGPNDIGDGGAAGRPSWDVGEDVEGFNDPDLLVAFPGLSTVESFDVSDSGEGGKSTTSDSALRDGCFRSEAECALLERAAHYALTMNADLQAATEEEASDAGDPSASSLLNSMSFRASRVESEITRRLRSEFSILIKPAPQLTVADVEAISKIGEASDEVGEAGVREVKRRAVLSCLRPFSALGSGMEAEKQFVRAVMQPFLDARFTQGIVDGGERGSSRGLGPLLDQLLDYVKKVAGDVLEAAEEMLGGAPSVSEASATIASDEVAKKGALGRMCDAAPLPVDLISNGVWKPVQKVLMAARLSSIFGTGMAAAQRTNYLLCMEFLEGLAGICGEEKRPQVRRRLLAQPSVSEFKARWNLPVYAQLRSREISTRLEAALSTAHGRGDGSESHEIAGCSVPAFELPVFKEAWHCLSLCWHPEVFIPSLAHRFLRLTLQGIGRIGAWAGSAEVLKLSPDNIVPVASDLDMLLVSLRGEFVAMVAKRLSAPAAGERHREGRGALSEDDARHILGEVVKEAVGAWDALIGRLWDKATFQVAEQCTSMLQAVKGITATYRMTNKPLPQRPSPFVPNVLRALRDFDERWGASASRKDAARATVVEIKKGSQGRPARGGWKESVVLAVCTRYVEIVSELLRTVQQMETTLNKRRVTARRGSRPGVSDQGPSDKDKIIMQLQLDVAEFGQESVQLGVDLSTSDVYRRLLEAVKSSPDN